MNAHQRRVSRRSRRRWRLVVDIPKPEWGFRFEDWDGRFQIITLPMDRTLASPENRR